MKILVADDESHIVNVVALKLRSAGFDVETASDGGEALERALELRPTLLVTDYNMPVMTGLEVCEKWSAERPGECRALLLTAKEGVLNEEDAKTKGVLAIMGKPFSPRELLAKVQELTKDA